MTYLECVQEKGCNCGTDIVRMGCPGNDIEGAPSLKNGCAWISEEKCWECWNKQMGGKEKN